MQVLKIFHNLVQTSPDKLKREAQVFLACEELIPTGQFTVGRSVDVQSPDNMLLTMKIHLAPQFQYRNLTALTSQSKVWRRSLQRLCCQKSGVSWRYVPDEKCAVVEGHFRTTRDPRQVRTTMEKVLCILLEWAEAEHESQGLSIE